MSTSISKLTGTKNYFEDFEVGAKLRHARGTTIGEIENQMLTKLVLNTADGHYNEHRMRGTNSGSASCSASSPARYASGSRRRTPPKTRSPS